MSRVVTGRRLLAASVLALAAAAASTASVSAFAGSGNAANGGGATPRTSIATVREQSLSSQTQASATLGYANAATIVNLAGAATGGGAPFVYTMLPQSGKTVRRGRPLYAVNGDPVLLLYGAMPAWRGFQAGMSAGRDVAELNANLRALGYGDPSGDTFSSATEDGVLKLQAAHGLAQTGTLPLGSIVFRPGAVRVASVDATLGAPAETGPVLEVSSTRHQVAVQLDPSQQGNVKRGDRVSVTLPDQQTTPGVITRIGTVAQTTGSSSSGAGSAAGATGSPTIEVDVRLLHEAAAGTLDQAPVQVAITTAAVKHALVVPVAALRALAAGGYAVETVDAASVPHLVPVRLGLFDDSDGLVQVSGRLHAGQRVVVPAT